MTTSSYQIDKSLFLVGQTVAKTVAVSVETPVNHIAVIDCSGSMGSDLPKIREQLKRKLPKLLKDGDTLSLIWFSGKGQTGALIEAEPVATLADLNDVNKAIDRWLRPVGMTGFKEPLLEVAALTKRVAKKNKHPFALFFMSDGCDNQWPRTEVLFTVMGIAGSLASATFVEYGYYADRPLLTAMAEKAGGTLVFAEAFDKYEPLFETAMSKHPVGGKRIKVAVTGDPIGGFAFAMGDGELTTYEVSGGTVLVSEATTMVWYLSPTKIGSPATMLTSDMHSISSKFGDAVYAAISLFAVRMMPQVVYPLLKATGDVTFIEAFASCFGKQRYSTFMEEARLAAFNTEYRLLQGYNPNRVPAEDAFTVLDLIRLLASDESTRLLLDDSAFKYSRVSRARVEADENLSSAEAEQLEVIRAKMSGEKSAKKLKEYQAEIDLLLATKRDALKFVLDTDDAAEGYPINGLVYNETRPNISLRVMKFGHVDLTARIANDTVKASLAKLDPTFGTFIYRNFTIIKDGLVNIEKLPVKISAKLYNELRGHNVQMELLGAANPSMTCIINVKPLPILNRQMVKAVSAADLLRLEWELTKLHARTKVLSYYQKTLFPLAKVKGWSEMYGEDAAAWLKEQGLTEYSGFTPKMVQAESTDVYVGKELKVKIKGFSSLPKVEDVIAKLGGKLTPPMLLMAPVIGEILHMKDVPDFEVGLTAQTAAAVRDTRMVQRGCAQIKMGLIVGQVWFSEFKSLDENTLTLALDGQDVTATFELKEIEIKV